MTSISRSLSTTTVRGAEQETFEAIWWWSEIGGLPTELQCAVSVCPYVGSQLLNILSGLDYRPTHLCGGLMEVMSVKYLLQVSRHRTELWYLHSTQDTVTSKLFFQNLLPLQLEKEAGMIDRQRKEFLINYNIRVNFVLPKYTFTIKDKSALHVIRVKRARILLTEWRVSMKDNTWIKCLTIFSVHLIYVPLVLKCCYNPEYLSVTSWQSSGWEQILKENLEYIVAYRPAANWWLCKQRPLLSNSRNNRTTRLCNTFLTNGSVNTFPR